MENQLKQVENVVEIFADEIIDPKDPMRSEINRDELHELADNIKHNGLINPITVRPVDHVVAITVPTNDTERFEYRNETVRRYEVVAGHRRFSACKIAGVLRIPCIVRILTDEEVFAVKAAENLERSDIDPIDESRFIARYIETTGKTIDEVAKQLNRSVGYVQTRLELGQTDEHMQEAIKHGGLKIGVALKLAQIEDANIRHLWTEMAARDGISIAQADYWLHGWKMNQLPGVSGNTQPPDGYTPSEPQQVRFTCQLSGLEEDARQFKTALIHESQWNTFLEIAREYQRGSAPEARGEAKAEPEAGAPAD